jgi:hypothetical protein
MGAILLSDSERAALRPRRSKSVHPLFKLLAVLSCAILFLAIVVWTGDRNKSNQFEAAKPIIDHGATAEVFAPVSPPQQ